MMNNKLRKLIAGIAALMVCAALLFSPAALPVSAAESEVASGVTDDHGHTHDEDSEGINFNEGVWRTVGIVVAIILPIGAIAGLIAYIPKKNGGKKK